jgi:glutamate-ammonia-ligase adenylyltransferase
MRIFHTSQERALSRKVIPQLIELALMSENPDRSIAGIESLLTTYGLKTAHLTAFLEQKELMEGIIKIFSASPYLTRVFLSSQHYLNILIEEWSILKTLSDIEEKLMRAIERTEKFDSALAEFRRFEEIRMGILFLLRILKIEDLVRGLSHLAEAIISEAMKKYGSRGLSVIAFGKLGGQEMSYGSDLDIVFVSETDEAMSAAEKILKTLTAYTDTGQVYSVDTRLRPDGSKGLLVKSVEGYRSYYLKNAQNWEIQALLKARPVGGDEGVSRLFMDMAKEVIQQRGPAVKKDDITAMRERIVKELAQESEGIDIKLGPGGVEEIEFYVQYLQLHYAEEFPDLLVQDTLSAVNRLAEKSLLEVREKDTLYSTYTYFRQVQTFLKLNEADVLTEGSDITGQAAKFMEHEPPEGFTDHLKMLRDNVLKVIYK